MDKLLQRDRKKTHESGMSVIVGNPSGFLQKYSFLTDYKLNTFPSYDGIEVYIFQDFILS